MRHSLLLYIVVGGVGFLVDGGGMMTLNSLYSWPPLEARLLSFPLAVTVTWLLNRQWTFRHGEVRASHKRYGYYVLVQVIGMLINLGVFAILVHLFAEMAAFPIVALAVAAIVSLGFTYTMSKHVVFGVTSSRGL